MTTPLLDRIREDADAAQVHLRSCTAYATIGQWDEARKALCHVLVRVEALKEMLNAAREIIDILESKI